MSTRPRFSAEVFAVSRFRVARLLGEIYPAIRAIAAEFVGKTLLISCYLEREPTDFDFESIEVLATNISTSTSGIDFEIS